MRSMCVLCYHTWLLGGCRGCRRLYFVIVRLIPLFYSHLHTMHNIWGWSGCIWYERAGSSGFHGILLRRFSEQPSNSCSRSSKRNQKCSILFSDFRARVRFLHSLICFLLRPFFAELLFNCIVFAGRRFSYRIRIHRLHWQRLPVFPFQWCSFQHITDA